MATGAADLFLNLDRAESAPEGLTRQIYAQLRAAILDGRLRAGDRLPPTRTLARELGVARLTVATAYDWLRAEGYVYGRVGAGTFVAAAFDQYAPEPAASLRKNSPILIRRLSMRPQPRLSQRLCRSRGGPSAYAHSAALANQAEGARYDLRPGVGAAELFPWARWRRVVGWPDPVDSDTADAAVRPTGKRCWAVGDTEGHRGLAAALAGGALRASASARRRQRPADSCAARASARRARSAASG